MRDLDGYKPMAAIPPTYENAESIQRLVLQDLVSGNFAHPTDLANPEDPAKVEEQQRKLSQYPDRYSGYQDENEGLIGFMKSNEWYSGDETPFMDNVVAAQALRVFSKLRGGSLPLRAYAAIDIVADESLPLDTSDKMLGNFFEESIERAKKMSAVVINFATHEGDPALEIAREKLYFEPKGSLSKTADTPAIHRVQRPVHSSSFSNF